MKYNEEVINALNPRIFKQHDYTRYEVNLINMEQKGV